MEKRELTCIGCPLGCSITVTMENAEILDVTGNTCKRGDAYGSYPSNQNCNFYRPGIRWHDSDGVLQN